jgi:hypothetical protein
MKLLQYLSEDYVTLIKSDTKLDNSVYHIYKNPNASEFTQIIKDGKSKDIRFMADIVNGDIYVWSAVGVLHNRVFGIIKTRAGLVKDDIVIGFGSYDGGKISPEYLTNLTGVAKTSWLDAEWINRFNKYIHDLPGFLKKYYDNSKWKFINEDYVFRSEDVEVFKCPSSKEIKECGNDIRFLITSQNDIYTWSAYANLTHYDVLIELGLDTIDDYVIAGRGKYYSGKIKVDYDNNRDCEIYLNSSKKDQWLEVLTKFKRYFSNYSKIYRDMQIEINNSYIRITKLIIY